MSALKGQFHQFLATLKLKWLFYRTEIVNKCVWLRMPRVETDSDLKTASGRFFQVFVPVTEIKSVKTDLS